MAHDTSLTDTASDPDSPDGDHFSYSEWVTGAGSILETSIDTAYWPDDVAAGLQISALKILDVILADLGKPAATISLLLCGDQQMQQLNALHRGVNKPTNVLSFPAFDIVDGLPPQSTPQDLPEMLGDIAIAAETVNREAADLQLPVADHLIHLFVHGVLHLFGYDHIDDAMAEIMEAQEIRFLAEIGVANPYQESQTEICN
jgi:probable rRNA maturation factor